MANKIPAGGGADAQPADANVTAAKKKGSLKGSTVTSGAAAEASVAGKTNAVAKKQMASDSSGGGGAGPARRTQTEEEMRIIESYDEPIRTQLLKLTAHKRLDEVSIHELRIPGIEDPYREHGPSNAPRKGEG